MANSWTLYRAGDWTGGSGTVLLGLLNSSASRLRKVRRIGIINTEDGAVASATKVGRVNRYTSATWTGQTDIAPLAHDTTNTALTDYKAGWSGTEGGSVNYLRQFLFYAEEVAMGGESITEFQALVPMGIIFDPGYGESEMQPLTLRQDESCIVESLAAAGTQDCDFWMEFTDE